MSISIKYRPANDRGKSFKSGTSKDYAHLREIFPGGEIGEDAGSILEAMAVASESEFFREVIEVVEKVGAIKFWGEY